MMPPPISVSMMSGTEYWNQPWPAEGQTHGAAPSLTVRLMVKRGMGRRNLRLPRGGSA